MPQFDLTIALGAWKHAHLAMPSAPLMGALRLVDIGCARVPGAAQLLPTPHLGTPAADAHKYTRGLLTIVGGAMPGATLLSAFAARHAGAGYLRLIAGADPGPVPHDLVVVHDAVDHVLGDRRIAAVLVGPGLGRDDTARARLQAALATEFPTVVDADALMLLRPDDLHARKGVMTVLTPHEGELATLERAFGLPGDGQKRDRALKLATTSGAVVVAKGPDTVIAAPDGHLILAPRASAWLSVAGTGDVLAGIMASRLAVSRILCAPRPRPCGCTGRPRRSPDPPLPRATLPMRCVWPYGAWYDQFRPYRARRCQGDGATADGRYMALAAPATRSRPTAA